MNLPLEQRLPAEDIQRIEYLYLIGNPCLAISKIYGCSYGGIYNLLIRNNIKIRDKSECKRKYKCNYGFFNIIDSEEKAYWLGFIAADGSVTDDGIFQIGLHLKDIKHLDKLARSMESTHPVKRYHYSSGSLARFVIRSPYIVESLKCLGITPRKSFTLAFPPLRCDLIIHFIRGYFDGDGGFLLSKKGKRLSVDFTGNRDFLITIRDYFYHTLSVPPTKLSLKTKTGIYSLRYTHRHWVRIIGDALYAGSNFYLERKRDRFCNFLKENPQYI